MKAARDLPPARRLLSGENARLRLRLGEAEETLRAIRRGEVDTVVVPGKKTDQVFTLEGAGHAYRVLIEAMNEGALTITADKMILYANQGFARMVKCPLEQVTGSSFRRFLSVADRETLRPLMKQAAQAGTMLQVELIAADGTRLPVQLSIRELARVGFERLTISMVVTDLTESLRTEELLRALTHRVVQVQETERGRVALELHDNITQMLCAVIFRSQALVDSMAARDGPAKGEALKLRRIVGQTAAEVERISQNLRPGVLDQLGLADALRAASTEFSSRTGVPVKLAEVRLTAPLPVATQLALFRIFQETMKNVEKHARAHRIDVGLKQAGDNIVLTITDDGVGFDAKQHAARRKGQGVLGLLAMRERATAAGGVLTVKSARRGGTEIMVRIPLAGGGGRGRNPVPW